MRIAGASMAGAIRAVSIEVGEDPREGALIAYGGAGPLFGSLLARELGIGTVVIPNYAGNFSAWGLLEQDMVRSAALTIVAPLDDEGIGRAEDDPREALRAARRAGREARRGRRRPTKRSSTCATRARSTRWRCPCRSPTAASPRPPRRSPRASPPPTSAPTATASRSASRSSRFARSSARRCRVRRTRPRRPRRAAARTDGTARAYSFAADDWLEFAVIDRAALRPRTTRSPGPAIVLEATTTLLRRRPRRPVHDCGVLLLTQGA